MIREDDGTVYLVDFGYARENTDGSRAKTYVGTPGYFAPEVILTGKKFSPDYNEAADIYSVGMVLFCMLYRKIPVRDETKRQRMYNGNHISPKAKYLIESMVRHDPKERPTTDHIIRIIDDVNTDFTLHKHTGMDKLIFEWKKRLGFKTRLDLSGFTLSDNDVQSIGKVLKTNNTLEVLYLYNNNITDVQSISEGLKTNNTLTYL